MSNSTLFSRAHFDGKAIVPDEPVDLPVDASLDVEVRPRQASAPDDRATLTRNLEALERVVARSVRGAHIPEELLRREHLYDDRA